MPRVLGIDVGGRRIGLAISDPSRTLARPLTTIRIASRRDAVDRVAREVARLMREEDGLDAIVVGVPRRLDGSPSEETRHVEAFIDALGRCTDVPIAREDERLTSRDEETELSTLPVPGVSALRRPPQRKSRRSTA